MQTWVLLEDKIGKDKTKNKVKINYNKETLFSTIYQTPIENKFLFF